MGIAYVTDQDSDATDCPPARCFNLTDTKQAEPALPFSVKWNSSSGYKTLFLSSTNPSPLDQKNI